MSQQNIYVDLNSIQSGEGITELTVVYDATDVEASGLGLRIHYDSSQLSVNGISNILQSDLVFAYDTPSSDSQDFDNDVTTDQYINLGWASLYGDWPGSAPISLVTISFADANLAETTVNFSASSHAVGYDFVGQSIQLSASSGEDVPPVFTSSDNASVDENAGESQVVYTASSDASSTVTYSLVDNTVYAAETSEATAPELVSATQMISAADVSSAQAGGQLSLTVNYSADDNQLPGLGLRIHFDSSLITVAEMTNIFAQDQIFVDAEAQADTDDYDANAATDSFVTAAWASVDGDWPNAEIPSELLTVLFDVSADASGTAAVGFSAIDTAIGYDFSAPSYDIAIMGSPLSIDATTGEVSLSNNPDFETQESYMFSVTATDTSGNAVDQAVTLSVNNLDEAAPAITSADSVAIDEDTGAGQVIYTATADDSADTSDGVSYSLVDSSVYTATTANADAPVDTQLVSVASYTASDANGQIAVTVNYNADDNQLSGLGLRIHYDSSLLTVADVTDALAQDLIYTDSGYYGDTDDLDANASTDAYITVGWASVGGDWPNTELPEELLTILFDLTGNAIAGGSAAIGFSSTSTPVGYDFSGTGYNLELIESPLSIDSATGAVTLSENPDYDVRDAYSFSVMATDAAGNASAPQAVTVTVNEAPDLPPVFTSPDTASVDENIGSQQVVYTAASDSSSEVVYSLADNTVYSGSQENANQADLLANTSMVSASGVSSAEAGEQVSLAINYNADDNQLPGLGLRIHYDSSKLTIAGVSNVLDQDLIYTDTVSQADAGDYDADASTDAYITVGWASLAGNWPDADLPSELLNVLFDVAADAVGDASVGFSSTSTPVGYEFAGEGYDIEIITSPLEIDSVTGEVTLIDNPDFESQDSYMFTVTATDTSGNAVDQAVTLSVNNLDEAAPVINSADSVIIDEGTGAGQVIYTATADDSADTSDGVSYSLVDSSVYTATAANADAPVDTQLVSVASYTAPDANGQIAVTVNYNADDNQLSGLGLRIHYDSSLLSVADITDVLAQDLIYTDSAAETDADDLDANASTDAFVTLGWASVGGDWPNTDLPNELLTILFDVAADASGSAAIGFSSSSTPVGYDFSGNGYALELIESPLSIDSVTGEVTLSENPDYDVRDAYSFLVTATDAAGNASAPQAITVAVNEVDDIPPAITSGDANAIDENSGVNQVIYTATADDSDISFSLSEDSDSALTIDSATGEVTLATDPDHETQSQYSFSVIATDAAGNTSDAQAVSLDINNLDEVAPVITSGDSATAVDENFEAGQVIYTATADDSADVSDGVSYSLVDDTDYTNTNTNSQQLSDDLQMVSVSGSPVAFGGEQVEISVAYNADDNQLPGLGLRIHFDSTKLSVAQVKDVLDQDLIFVDADTQSDADDYDADSSTDSFVTVAWASMNGNWPNEDLPSDLLTVVFDVASDTSGDASIGFSAISTAVGYELSATSYDLEIVNSPLSIDSATGEVTLVESPDFEAQDSYNFTVVATDAAGNVSDSQSVSLDVNNLDEVAPTITSDAATIVIDENSGAGQVVYTATADDSLDISNGVTFSLVESYGHMNNVSSDLALSINAETGEVTLADNPDYEAQDSYFFAVVATDAAGNTGNMQSMMIEVNNLDEVAPAITSATTATAVDENSGAGQVIYTATAEDSADTSDGFTFSLADGSDDALTIDSATGEVTLATDPDHETQSQYSFSVIATDSAGNTSDAQSVTLDINDLDDAAPAITSGATAAAIDENSGAGQVVYTATADDSADDVSDTPITYSLEEGSDTALSINSDTGEVILNTDPDHETQSQYSFAVIATDAAGNQSNAQSVSLEINDLDDAAPIIISGDTAVAINENSGADQIIYTATSNDSADNVSDTPITYSLSEDSDTALSIDPATGDVTLTNNPDHEAQSQYSFAVIATDAAGNASEAQSVTLDINDLDDAAPSITSGAVADAIDENSGAGQVVYTATADDSADDVADTPIIYSLTSDSDTGLSIDSVTGVVTLNSNPNYESQSQYSFAVIATDNAGNASEAQAVNLEINNLDDAAPTITSGATAVAIDENSGAVQVIYTATADDSTDISEGITFSLAEGSDAELSIDSATGAVTLASVPNYETQSQYSFAVIATDAAGNASAAQSVTLDINNLDEVAPTITSGDSAAVLESSGADALVYRAIADDSADVSTGVTFSLSEDSDVALSIDSVTGEVTLADEPDFAAKPSYSFTVIADDGVNQSHKAVTLSVVDEDLEAPVFTSSATVAIDENIGENQVIYTAITNDESLVNYSLSEDSDISLSINSASGAVTLVTDPDSEAQSEYNFTVIATDIANNVSQQTVTVSINDLDDAAPTVTSGAVADAIDENSGAGQVIYTVTADDSGDDVAATPITYSLTEGSDTGLSIDALTGAVSLTTDPDHESQSEYSFAVVATDAAGNTSEAQSVTLNINDLDDAAPTITSGAVASIIDENTGAGQVIYTATADDSADISDGYSFSLAEGSDAGLTIDASSGAVSLTADPDHETQSQYSFAVIATDTAGNSSAAQSVILNIVDLDDAAPTITSADTADAIDENSGAGQVIYSASSNDSADDVVKGPISYSLAEGSDAGLTIDSQSGLVTLISDPDHESQSEYNFSVIATDGAGNASEPKSVSLNINDLDDAAPTITSGTTATAIDENSGAEQVIYTATADDSADVSEGVSFSLADGSDSALSIDATSGEVTLASDPDHEVQSQYSFSVIATDAAGNQSASQAVTLDINDLDDADPVLTSSDTATAIDENSGAGQVVYTATADDSADISDGVSFSLASNTAYGDAPELAENTQHVYVSESTLSSDGTQVSVVVSYNSLVSDTTGLGLRIHFNSNELSFNAQSDVLDTDFIFSADAAVADDADYDTNSSTDTYLDAGWASVDGNWPNEGMPTDLMTLTFDINPGASSQTAIGVSSSASPIGVDFEGQMYDLALESGSMSAGSAFSINSETGEVTLVAVPDFESASEYSFSVMATDAAGNTSELQDVSLSINNLDEIAPVITSADSATAIDENSGVGQVIYTATADDSADLSDGFTFSLGETSDAAISIDSSSGEVTLTTNPDYEVQNQYNFVVIATDAAGNQSDEKSITLSINNLDDTAPIITSANTATVIDENSGAEQVIYTATADDSADVSDGVTFSLAEGSDSALTIDATSGEVTLSTDPDHETQSQYSFSVIATDAAGNQSASQAVTLDINDLDDASPVLTSSDTATAIDENSGADQVVYTATADDSADISDGVSFSLASNTTYADAPDLAANTQHVYVSQSTLSDDGTQVSVVVSYSALVAATTGLGLRVHFNSNELTFNAQSDVLDTDLIFSADAAVADDADYDANTSTDSYLNIGWASVSGNWPDEGMPADLMTLTFDINSEAPSQTVIGVSAISSPVGVAFDGQMYDLALDSGSMSAGSAFSIDSETGEVTLLANPDFESASEYSFSVMAIDAAGNTSELQDVTLSINNLDESAPVITSGEDAEIDENSGAGQVVYIATADDSSDVSDGVTFSLGEASDAVFTIDSASGVVTLTTDSDYEVQNQYNFVVVATDAAGNQSDAQSVTLNINNTDDTAPVITSADTAAAIDENTGAGQVVYTATADDSSDVSNGVTFSLSADSDSALSIDASTGEVSLTTDPDFETQSQYSFTVIASDGVNAEAQQTVTLDINNIDEVAPVITSDAGSNIDENSGAGQVIYTATSDDSADVSDGVTYSLVDGTSYGNDDSDGEPVDTGPLESEVSVPELSASTQHVYVSSSTKSEDGTQETIVISYNADDTTSTGLGLRIHFDSSQLSVANLEGVLSQDNIFANDNAQADTDNSDNDASTDMYIDMAWASLFGQWPGSAPTDLATLTFDIAEGASGSSAINFTASSNASGFAFEGQTHNIAISDESETEDQQDDNTENTAPEINSDLSIDSTTGEVTLAANPDYETESEYSFSVVATDAAGNVSDTQEVTVSVNNLDETAPTITSVDTGSIDENSGLGQVIYTATANDSADVSEGLSFSLAAGSDSELSIDSATGEVTLATDPNFEAQSQYSFTVVATDGANNSADQQVTITVNNLDEVAPTITSADTAAAIDENTGAGQVVYTATADDSADVSNGVTFSLSDDSDSALSIDASTGEVSLDVDPDFETQSQYSFTVIASDGVNADSQQAVTLDINNVDEVAPVITSDSGSNIDENSGAGQVIYTATSDDSADISGGVTYSLVDGTSYGNDDSDGEPVDTGPLESEVSVPELSASTQHVYVSSSTKSEDGTQETIVISYNADDTTSTGLGLRIHFDSSQLSVANLEGVLSQDNIFANDNAQADTDNSDNDASTDMYIDMAWASLFGQWPGSAPTDLATLTFDIAEGASGSSAINFTASSNASGFAFEGQTHNIAISNGSEAQPDPEASLDYVGETPEVQANTQQIFVSESQVATTLSDQGDLQGYAVISYTSDHVESTGLGLRIHFASDMLDIISITDALGADIVFTNSEATADTNDYDNNPSSDRFVDIGWASVYGNWPDGELPADLLTINFAANPNSVESPTLSFSAIDTPVGLDFVGHDYVIGTESDSDQDDNNDSELNSDISINSETGEVTLAVNPDYETESEYNFAVVATDAEGNASDPQNVTISINNLDEVAPVMSPGQINPVIDENSDAGQVVYTAVADDSQDISAGITFSLSEDSDTGLSIDELTGEVVLEANPNYETQSEYNFTVIASDSVNSDVEQSVTLQINNLDEVAPVFTSGDSAGSMDENSNSAAGQVIYTAVADDSLDISNGINYSLIDENGGAISGPAESVVSVPELAAATQHVYVSSSTKSEDGSQETLVISYNADDATTTGMGVRIHFDSTKLSVSSLENVLSQDNIFANAVPTADNDNFDGDSSTDSYVDIAWASLFGAWPGSAPTDLATLTFDIAPDASGSSAINFTASSNASGFAFDGQSHEVAITAEATSALSINSETGEVSLAVNPDYEIQDEYSFTVIASDGVNNPVEQQVTLDINNIDEVSPIITSGAEVTEIEENSGAGQVVYTATADDSQDTSAGVTFALSSDSDAALSIDASTGAVTLANNPDFEAQEQYNFTVIASDGVNQDAQQSLTLSITDLDDTGPIITSPDQVSADENVGADAVVYTVTTNDTGPVSYELISVLQIEQGAIDQRYVDNGDGSITLQLFVDESLASNYANGLQNYDLLITYNDDEITDPQISFPDIAFLATSYESVPGEIQTVTTIFPGSLNVSENPLLELTYQLEEGVNSAEIGVLDVLLGDSSQVLPDSVARYYGTQGFSIDANTGEVSINDNPDHEMQVSYNFTVAATDAAGNQSEAVTVNLSINDLDDSAPTFVSADSISAINENTGAGQVIYTANADDSGDISDGVTYSLTGDSDTALEIDSISGQVTLLDNPDYEAQSSYSFTVVATDAAGNASQDLPLSITINNLDDTAPEITSADTADAIDENSGAGQVVYTATADDSLDIESGALTFSLTEDSDLALTIDATTGEVSLSADADFEAQSQYSFAVVATDAAGNASEAQSVILDVNNLDELAATITSADSATVNENTGSNQVIYTATADDSADISDGIIFSLAEDSDPALSIDANSGAVTLANNPDYETQSDYSFTLVATDAAGNESQQNVTLDINNLDDTAAVITSGDSADAIDENSGAGQVIYTATADDSADVSDGVTFSLAAGSDSALSIDADTGAVTLNADPDHETQSEYNFAVVATDAAGNVSQAQSVTLDINNLDDTAAVITSGDTANAIDENSGAGQVIYTATADDSADVSDGVTFSLAAGSDAALSIDAGTGAVTLNTDPDHETQSQYSFTVVATDVAGNESAGQSVTLDITDIDDIAATITSGDTAEAIDENSGTGQVIYTATADDSADVSDGFTFSLAEGSDPALSIDANTGAVTLTTDADYETQSQYSFSVVATDAAGNHSEAQSVTLDINNLDEVAPTITSVSTAAVDENMGQNQVIYTVTSDDTSDISQGVTYSLSETADSALSIDADTGEVSLSTDPDYETQSEYQFTVFATDAAGNQSAAQTVTVSINDLDDSAVSGMVYHWGTQTMMDNVSISMHSQSDGEMMSTMTTDSSGAFAMTDLPSGDVTLTVERDMQEGDGSRVVTSADVLGALKIAVGMNPNTSSDGQQNRVSPYQFIAADVNKDGRVSSADALAILHMAVNMPNAIDQEWMFVAEDTDFWNEDAAEGENPFSTNKYDVDWDSDGTDMSLTHPAQMNYVGVMLGDVNNSWSAPEDAIKMPQSHLNQLEADGIAPLEQWNLSPDADIEPPTIDPTTADAVVENSGADQVVYTASSFDNSATFSLTADSDSALSINGLTGAVTLADNPDFEAQSQYSFAVIATDAAGNDSVAHQVTVEITNIDDAAPTITSADTAVAVDENSGAGQVVYTATADDSADTSDGVTFSLANEALGFSIDADSGEVTTNADFAADFENAQSQSITLVATDAAGNSAQQQVNVAINNLDEVAATITSGDTAVAVDENSGAGQVIYTATATDGADISQGVTFSLTDETLGLSIDASSGAVTTNADFVADYETATSQSFTVVATDGAGNASQQTVSVAVNNVDEVAPVFESSATASVLESEPAGVAVYQVLVDDSSDISNGVTYSLSGVDAQSFDIDQAGVVSIIDNPEAAVQSTYAFTVIADDGLNQSQQAVTLTVIDQDLEAPVFTSSSVANAIDENSGANQVVYTATSNDETDVSYSLEEGSDSAISIDASSGTVRLATDPDHETQSQYSFSVIATDAAGNSSQQQVTLDINDLDDAAPTVTSGATAVAIDENSGASQVIYTTTSTDLGDDVSDTPIAYSLAEGSDAALSIDASTGAVTLATDPDHETQSQYSFAVIATDAAGNASEAQSVTLDINDLDDAAPTVTSGATAVAIDENSGAAQVIYTATADDSADTSDGFTFSLSEDSNVGLSIDALTGEVTLATNPDYETQSQYSFAVIATDAAGNTSESQSVTLDINNLDEAAPIITSAAETVVVDTDETNPVIYTATADDSADISGGVSFSLNDTTVYANTSSAIAESMVTIPDLLPASQHVYVSSSTKSEDGTQETVVVSYNADDTTTTGLGLRIHFDSSALSASDIATLMTNDLLVNAVVESDDSDLDGDASTDQYISFGWASLFGQWPNAAPADLASITFDIAEGATGSSAINFTASSNAAGFAFDDQSHEVAITGEDALVESQLSIDSATGEVTLSGELDPATQSEYSFTVTATDTAGNSSDLDVVVDAEQPMVDVAMVVVVDGDTPSAPIYQASANVEGVSYQITDLTQYPDTGSGSAESTVTIPELAAATQHVYVSSSTKSEDGTQETVVVSYNADDTTTTGLGLRIHFDSSVLSASDITTLMTNDLLVNAVVESDDSDLDGDASTDTYVQFGWASLFGQWPNAAPVDLASITFDITEGATGSSAINFSISSNAAGFAFDGQDHNLVLAAEAVVPAAELVIDNAAGTVSLDATVNTVVDYSFRVEGTDADGDAIGSQIVPVVVVDQIVNADASSYTGTADEDVFALADGSAEITSGAGEDEFILDPAFASATHTITDFESGVDTIHISEALLAAGYNTSDNAPTQLASAEMSADILDLVNGDDSSLDNLFGATYDEDSNTLTVFADNDSSVGATDMNSIQITLDENATVEDEDIVANLSPFIA